MQLSEISGIIPQIDERESHVFKASCTDQYCKTYQAKLCMPGNEFLKYMLDVVGVLCEIVNKDGTMARKAELQRFAKDHDLSIITIADLVRYRIHHENKTLESH